MPVFDAAAAGDRAVLLLELRIASALFLTVVGATFEPGGFGLGLRAIGEAAMAG
jgi:hypothetical protein